MKTLHTYDEVTKEYIGEEEQYIDPLESEKAGRKIYIKITNGTTSKPKATSKFKANVFKNGSFELVDDYRSAEMFDTDTMEKVHFELGEKPLVKHTLKNPAGFNFPLWDKKAKVWTEKKSENKAVKAIKKALKLK